MYTISHLADLFEAASIQSPYSCDYAARRAWQDAHPGEKDPGFEAFREHDRLGLDESQLPERWMSKVHDELGKRRRRRQAEKVEKVVRTLPEPLQTLLREKRRSPCFMPEKVDLRDLAKLAKQDRRYEAATQTGEHGKPLLLGPTPYQPEGGCQLRFKLGEAVYFDHEQAAYADHARYMVPVVMKDADPGDLDACHRNLSRFAEALRTHNGQAGSGCNWSATLHALPDGFVVELECRASICD